MNVALYWNDILQFIENELKPGSTKVFDTGIGWHDFVAVVDTGENRFSFDSNFDSEHLKSYGFSLAGWTLTAAGIILAPATGGLSLTLTAIGIGLNVGEAVTSGWVAPATLKGLFASDGHQITVGLPDVVEESDADGRNALLHGRPAIECLNLTTRNILVESNWNATEAMTSLDDSVFAVWAGELHEFGRRRWSRSLGGGWGGTEAMTSLDGKLYAVQGGRLWEKEPPHGSKDLGGGWGGTEAMTSLDGKLYAVQGGKLWEKEPPSGSRQLGKVVYHPTRGIAAMSECLALVVGDQLWLREI